MDNWKIVNVLSIRNNLVPRAFAPTGPSRIDECLALLNAIKFTKRQNENLKNSSVGPDCIICNISLVTSFVKETELKGIYVGIALKF